MSPSLTSIVTASTTQTSSTRSSKSNSQRHGASNGGILSLLSPISPSLDTSLPKAPSSSSLVENDPHAYRHPVQSDSRCPCPALNTLANHGYLPRDGKNISMPVLLAALQHPNTYHLSEHLAKFLATGGAALTEKSPAPLIHAYFMKDTIASLHDLALHGQLSVEHDASVGHKNAAPGQKYAPVQANTPLIEDFLGDRQNIKLADIAHRRVALERASQLDPLHAEIARGEWALVIGIFGRVYDGKIPADVLRMWLKDNRLPEEWPQLDCEQTLPETISTASKIRDQMHYFQEHDQNWSEEGDERLRRMLTTSPGEVEM